MFIKVDIVLVSENESIAAFRCLGLFLRTKKRGETLFENDEDVPFLMRQAPVSQFEETGTERTIIFFLLPQRSTPPSEAVDHTNNQPYILRFVDAADSDFTPQYFIVVERSLLIECKNIKTALFSLFAVHYIFNVEYHSCVQDFHRFVQEFLLEIPVSTKKTNVCTGIQSFLPK